MFGRAVGLIAELRASAIDFALAQAGIGPADRERICCHWPNNPVSRIMTNETPTSYFKNESGLRMARLVAEYKRRKGLADDEPIVGDIHIGEKPPRMLDQRIACHLGRYWIQHMVNAPAVDPAVFELAKAALENAGLANQAARFSGASSS